MYITTVLLSLVFVYGIYTYFMHLVIFSTGIIGSYAAVRAIGMFAGQYPNEFTIIE